MPFVEGTADLIGQQLLEDRYADDPIGWATDILGVHLWLRQRDIVEAVRDHRRVAVRSGHGIGKTLTAAVLTMWFLDCHPDSRVITTATKWSQVEGLLWHEINRLHTRARSRPQTKGRPIFAVKPLRLELKLPDGRYARGLNSKPENSETFQGHHAPNILVIYDEASGIHSKIFEAGEGYMTTDGAHALLIGNPTRTSGDFFDAFHSKRDLWRTLHVSALESPAITGEQVPEAVRAAVTGQAFVDDARKKWGEESPMYAIRVLGDFAKLSSDTVIDLGAVEDAQARELPADSLQDLVVIGCDVARFGTDETVIAERVGQRIRIVETYVGKPTTHTAGRVAYWASRHPAVATRVVVDDVGVGGGVTDQLRASGLSVTAFNGGHSAFDSRQYPNRRSELWFQAAAEMPLLDLDDDDQLAADLTGPQYSYDVKLRRVVERKDETKRRLGRSPDRGDAVLLTLVAERSPGAIVLADTPFAGGRARREDGRDPDLMRLPDRARARQRQRPVDQFGGVVLTAENIETEPM
jgi:phage terminase large subunit